MLKLKLLCDPGISGNNEKWREPPRESHLVGAQRMKWTRTKVLLHIDDRFIFMFLPSSVKWKWCQCCSFNETGSERPCVLPNIIWQSPHFFLLEALRKASTFPLILLDLAEIIKINPDLRFPRSIWGFLQGKLMTQLMVCLLDKRLWLTLQNF